MNIKNIKKLIAATTAALTVFASMAAVPAADDAPSLFGSSAITVSAKASTKVITEADMDAFHEMSYEIAEKYLTTEVEKRWKEVIEQTI